MEANRDLGVSDMSSSIDDDTHVEITVVPGSVANAEYPLMIGGFEGEQFGGVERFQSDPVFFRIYTQSTQGWPARIRAAMGESAQAHFTEFVQWIVGLARDAAAAGALRGIEPEVFGLALMGALVNVTSAISAGTTTQPTAALARDVRVLFERLLEPEPLR